MKEYSNHLLSAGRGTSTAAMYVGRIRLLARTHPSLLDVTTVDLEEYLADRRTSLAAESRKALRSAFRSFYGWAHATGRISTNPAAALRSVRVPATVPRIAKDDVVQLALLTAPVDEQAMILLGRLACLRLSEITHLHTKHREGDTLRVTGKGEKQRLVPINDHLMGVLLTLERQQGVGYYFPGRYGGAQHVSTIGRKITTRTGTNPHSLRHAGATAAYRSTNDLRAVQLLLGHSSLATTQRYLHVGMDAVRRAAEGTAFVSAIANPHDVDRIFRPGNEPSYDGRFAA
ncbi:tyrosine-type recombinase/integrase [Marisediminicola sp. LYQ134]|uniref:tyrosine-type recombinase/integrase n=1 Tax=Marisediminicola sp. LYQ134 TaxID=3391061 RepID=UPI003983AFA3